MFTSDYVIKRQKIVCSRTPVGFDAVRTTYYNIFKVFLVHKFLFIPFYRKGVYQSGDINECVAYIQNLKN